MTKQHSEDCAINLVWLGKLIDHCWWLHFEQHLVKKIYGNQYLKFDLLSSDESDTPFPSIIPCLSAVGTTDFLQATYKAQASQ